MSDESKLRQAGAMDSSVLELAQQRDEARQQAESEEAQRLLQQLSESPSEQQASEKSDEDKRRAHEEAEAQRRADWEAKKQAREDEIQFAWEQAVDLSDTDLMTASVKRLGDMTERLTRRNMKLCVTESIQTLCYEDLDFARLVMHPRKSMINCFKYINRKALEYLKQEMQDNGEKAAGVSMIGGDVPDAMCYQWAEEYFRDLKAPEDKTEADQDFVSKPYTGTAKSSKKAGKKPAPKAEKKPVLPSKVVEPAPANDQEQISLFEVCA